MRTECPDCVRIGHDCGNHDDANEPKFRKGDSVYVWRNNVLHLGTVTDVLTPTNRTVSYRIWSSPESFTVVERWCRPVTAKGRKSMEDVIWSAIHDTFRQLRRFDELKPEAKEDAA